MSKLGGEGLRTKIVESGQNSASGQISLGSLLRARGGVPRGLGASDGMILSRLEWLKAARGLELERGGRLLPRLVSRTQSAGMHTHILV